MPFNQAPSGDRLLKGAIFHGEKLLNTYTQILFNQGFYFLASS
ncbi:hypothetical protein DJ91_5708 [Priestia megaterium]|nr:hypothetical protein DJ91_5708 [Priestia megaterium]